MDEKLLQESEDEEPEIDFVAKDKERTDGYPEVLQLQTNLINLHLTSTRVSIERLYEMYKEILKNPLVNQKPIKDKQIKGPPQPQPKYLG